MNIYLIILLSITPILSGILYSFTLSVPVIGELFTYILPFTVICVWFYLGYYLARQNKLNFWYWTGITHASGFICLILHFIGFYALESTPKPLALISGLFVNTLAPFISRIAMIFERVPNETTRFTETFIQISGILFMLLVFICGYIRSKIANKK